MKKKTTRYDSIITEPHHKQYNPDIGKIIVAAICTAILLGIIISHSSCNAYKGIEKKPPLTSKDSSRLAARSLATFPVKPPVYKPGKTIIVKGKDSTDFYKKKLKETEGKKVITQKDIEYIYQDTCTTANDVYKTGFDLGYEVGLYDCKSKYKEADTVTRVDTFFTVPAAYQVALIQSQSEAAKAGKELLVMTEKFTNKRKWFWIFFVTSIVLLAGNIWQIRKGK